ncbi:peptidase M48 [Methylobacterium sp. Leaf99]|uniref:M48 family metallopeptidase n=1 Tax=Methylobacterium sp. Leaf99 TaxID=1736251 RepID=UPI0006FE1971|nr:M48 family metallopeptidase [Methylobacterium sp. Leaf99]KQP04175.1 peptidase M48 [Methylobacterium sp. Leaf99]
MTAPPTARGAYFDGFEARAHPVTLHLSDHLEIVGPDLYLRWNPVDLVADDASAPLLRVGPRFKQDRVEIQDPAFGAALTARCPGLRRGATTVKGAGLRLVVWSVAAAIVAFAMALYGIPALASRLAPLVPFFIEAQLGEAVDRHVRYLLDYPPPCDDRSGRASLDRLVARLARDGGLPEGVQISVRQHDSANAFALPGRRVILLSALIDAARTPDELAAVLAHEFGHVSVQDPMRAVIAASGTSILLSLVIGDLSGSTVLIGLGQATLAAGYSRDAESAADAYAVRLLQRAGGDASALATILERLDGEADSSALGILRSHPFVNERAHAIRALAGQAPSAGLLSDEEWKALKSICEVRYGMSQQ